MLLRIENDYEDGHHTEREVELPAGPLDEDWWQNVVWPHTGDGHGVNLNACYTATIVEADDPEMVGQSWEWC